MILEPLTLLIDTLAVLDSTHNVTTEPFNPGDRPYVLWAVKLSWTTAALDDAEKPYRAMWKLFHHHFPLLEYPDQAIVKRGLRRNGPWQEPDGSFSAVYFAHVFESELTPNDRKAFPPVLAANPIVNITNTTRIEEFMRL